MSQLNKYKNRVAELKRQLAATTKLISESSDELLKTKLKSIDEQLVLEGEMLIQRDYIVALKKSYDETGAPPISVDEFLKLNANFFLNGNYEFHTMEKTKGSTN